MQKQIIIDNYSINIKLLDTYQRYLKIAECLTILEYSTIDEDTKIIDEVIQELKNTIQLVEILTMENRNIEERELILRHVLMTDGESLDNVFSDWQLGNQLLRTKVTNTYQLIHEATDFEFADDWGMLPPQYK